VRVLAAGAGILIVLVTAAMARAAPKTARPVNSATPSPSEAVSSEVSPEEQRVVDGLALLRAWKPTEADPALAEVCPEFKDDAGEGSTLEDLACSARAVSLGEVRGAKDATERADGYWWAGERARRSERAQVARAFFDLALDRNPRDSNLWTSIGRLDRDVGDLAASSTAFHKAMELDATNLDAVYWLAANRMDQSADAEAETLLRGIVAKDKKFGHAWFRLGELAMRRGEPQGAIELFEKSRSQGVDKKLVSDRIAECKKALAKKMPA
jgi:tetratricopeptide (TPR) repeat protein